MIFILLGRKRDPDKLLRLITDADRKTLWKILPGLQYEAGLRERQHYEGSYILPGLGAAIEVTRASIFVNNFTGVPAIEYKSVGLGRDVWRRDFSVNGIYMDAKGNLYDDACKGLTHVQRRKVRFIKKPIESLREDPVRLPRYCRYLAMVDVRVNAHQEEIKACAFMADQYVENDAYKTVMSKGTLDAIMEELRLLLLQQLETPFRHIRRVLDETKCDTVFDNAIDALQLDQEIADWRNSLNFYDGPEKGLAAKRKPKSKGKKQ